MTGKERAEWRKQANTLSAIFQIGKDNITEPLIEAVDAALKKRELIKLSVLETSELTAKEAAVKSKCLLPISKEITILSVLGSSPSIIMASPDNMIIRSCI